MVITTANDLLHLSSISDVPKFQASNVDLDNYFVAAKFRIEVRATKLVSENKKKIDVYNLLSQQELTPSSYSKYYLQKISHIMLMKLKYIKTHKPNGDQYMCRLAPVGKKEAYKSNLALTATSAVLKRYRVLRRYENCLISQKKHV